MFTEAGARRKKLNGLGMCPVLLNPDCTAFPFRVVLVKARDLSFSRWQWGPGNTDAEGCLLELSDRTSVK